ncbi:MAG: hypothetical protein V4850_27105 [Myxococcota bacterium]
MSLRVASTAPGGLAVGATGGPRALAIADLDAAALIVGTSGVRPVGAPLLVGAQIGTFARSAAPGRPVVVVGVDDEAAAAVSERLSALGIDAGWLFGGVGAWKAAGRALLGPAEEAT